ncbi:MAG: 2-C-methyl-D-erythritol 4-phosphate cytidylyltransferase [Micavibrio sp.]
MTMESSASIDKPVPFSVLIVAGGSGTRLGGSIPKQYQKIGHYSVLNQSILQFLSCKGLRHIRLVCDPSHAEWVHDTVRDFKLPPPARAGKDRKSSVYNGLLSFSEIGSEDIILIHDAARPLVSVAEIEAVVKAVDNSGAATLAVPVSDTLTRGEDMIDRGGLYAIQTPQGFRAGIIREAHEKFKDHNDFTDDSGMVRALGHKVTLVPGNRRNFKITTADDLEIARQLMNSSQKETRTALGFDVHAFDVSKPGPIRLGGVNIPFEKTLAGHSDADVGLHAITDAILGTIAAGDIGQHFPPSDPQWKGADSTVFLAYAVKLLHQKNAVITLIDLTFMCELPKIGPHREAMQAVISRVTGISPDRISIKATTTEKLGFTGRGEGIAAQALVTVEFPV